MILDAGPVSSVKQMDGSWGFPLAFRFHIYFCDDKMVMVANARTCGAASDGLWVGGKKKLKYALMSGALKVLLFEVEIMGYF